MVVLPLDESQDSLAGMTLISLLATRETINVDVENREGN